MSQTDKIITRTCQPNEIIFRQGDPGRHLYLILNGSVEIYKTIGTTRQLINRLGTGEIFGELGLLTNAPRCATAVALETTRLIMVSDRLFHHALVNNHLPIVKPLTRQLAQRLKETEALLEESRHRVRVLEYELGFSHQSRQSEGRTPGR
jgi:CRP-like cAMP-binding protein